MQAASSDRKLGKLKTTSHFYSHTQQKAGALATSRKEMNDYMKESIAYPSKLVFDATKSSRNDIAGISVAERAIMT